MIRVKAVAAMLGFAGLVGMVGVVGGGGCSGMTATAEGNIGSRTVLASTGGGTVRLRNHDGESADIDAGGRTVHVTASQLTWSPGGTLALPDPRTQLEIRQFRRKTYVFVDGKEFGTLPPEK